MSLDWSVQKVKNWKELQEEKDGETQWKLKTSVLPLAMMFVRLDEITQANHEEFWRRLDLWQHGVDAFMYRVEKGKRVDDYFTYDDVKRHIGMYANVTSMTTRQWDTYFRGVLVDKVEERRRAHRRWERAESRG